MGWSSDSEGAVDRAIPTPIVHGGLSGPDNVDVLPQNGDGTTLSGITTDQHLAPEDDTPHPFGQRLSRYNEYAKPLSI